MKKSSIAASIVWCSFLILPSLLLRAPVRIELGFFSGMYAFLYFFFETFENMTFARIFATVALTTEIILILASLVCIIYSKVKKIYAVTIAATLGEFMLQLAATLLYEEKNVFSFFSPFCVLLLLIWLIYIAIRQKKIN